MGTTLSRLAALAAVVAVVAAVAAWESAWWGSAAAGLLLSVCLGASLVDRRAEPLAVAGGAIGFAALWAGVGLEAGLWALIGVGWLSGAGAIAVLLRGEGRIGTAARVAGDEAGR